MRFLPDRMPPALHQAGRSLYHSKRALPSLRRLPGTVPGSGRTGYLFSNTVIPTESSVHRSLKLFFIISTQLLTVLIICDILHIEQIKYLQQLLLSNEVAAIIRRYELCYLHQQEGILDLIYLTTFSMTHFSLPRSIIRMLP